MIEKVSLLTLLTIVIVLVRKWPQSKNHKPLPPGPKELPIIGNLHQHPWSEPWRTYQEWHKKYGPLISFKLGPCQVISIGHHTVAKDLLERRGAIYSSRPKSLWNECMTRGLQPILQSYTPSWKSLHRVQAPLLSSTKVRAYLPLLDLETRQLLIDLLLQQDMAISVQRYAFSLASRLLTGERVPTGIEVSFHKVRDIIDEIFSGLHWSYLLSNIIPAVGYLPEWVVKFKKVGNAFYSSTLQAFTEIFSGAVNRSEWTWTRAVLQHRDSKNISWEQICFALGELWIGLSATTPTTLLSFTRLSVLHPDKFQKLQQEIDSLVGPDRLPTPQDLDNMSYLKAFVNEVLRLESLVPLGFLRTVDKDDEYMGYHIPANSIIIPNTWCLDHDESVYPNAHGFVPERWLEDPTLPLAAFGLGRRKCPGRHLAHRSLHLAIARIAWGFNVASSPDSLPLSPDYVGFVLCPNDFRGVFEPRGAQHKKVIEDEWRAGQPAEGEFSVQSP